MAMAVQTSRVPLTLAGVGIILFIGALLHQVNGVPAPWKASLESSLGKVGGSHSFGFRPSLYNIALSHGSDKVTMHDYHHMYQKYLGPYRDKPLKMLQIGLDCDMEYGPGASYFVWLEFFPKVDLYFIGNDAACAEKWAANTTGATVFTGDQADVAFLNDFMHTVGTDFDIIIDAGGHVMKQQIVSLQNLWKAIVPGGLYFCEGLQTSYWESTYTHGQKASHSCQTLAHSPMARLGHGGDPLNSGKKKTMMGMVKELTDDLNVETGEHKRKHEISLDMQGVDCMEEICALVKKRRSEM